MKRLDLLWGSAVLSVSILLLFPDTRNMFILATQKYPYWLGFIKFGVFATLGELLAFRISSGRWKLPRGILFRIGIWGIVGMLIVFMFPLYQAGVDGVIKWDSLFTSQNWIVLVLRALMISTVMNLTFAPVFMSAHRVSDSYIDQFILHKNSSIMSAIQSIDWPNYLSFVVGKTIPFFWIPAHTVTFLIPAEFRVIYAAYLSIALGAILSFARKNGNK